MDRKNTDKTIAVAVAILLGISAILGSCTARGREICLFILFRLRGGTGTIYFTTPNGCMEHRYYKDNRREGTWKTWDKDGNLYLSEYKKGRPWNGICYLVDHKLWLCEYKNGKPWNGYLPKSASSGSPLENPEDWGYFINGSEVSHSEYCRHCGTDGTNYSFYGLAGWSMNDESKAITTGGTVRR